MKVVLLGAGASKCAGYPLASQLMSTLMVWAQQSHDLSVQNDWRTWILFRENTKGLVRLLLDDPNPEIALSLLDLCDSSSSSGLAAIKPERRDDAISQSLSSNVFLEEYFLTPAHEEAFRAAYARNALLRCLSTFFLEKHADDGETTSRKRRRYLRDLLSSLHPDDVIITLNWDTTVERTLLEEGRWNPRDGYGFKRPLRPLREPEAGVEWTAQSQVTVLKLHGSVGWHRSERRGLYFDNSQYLAAFPLASSSAQMVDPSDQEFGPPDEHLLIHPSFLKDLGAPEIRKIWDRAAAALRKADAVDVWGYSLPKSDHAVRALIFPLRRRLEEGRRSLTVTVHDPSGETLDRWRQLLGEKLRLRRGTIGCEESRIVGPS